MNLDEICLIRNNHAIKLWFLNGFEGKMYDENSLDTDPSSIPLPNITDGCVSALYAIKYKIKSLEIYNKKKP